MGINRVFLPQECLDALLADEKISIDGSRLTILAEERTYELRPAVRFLKEVGGGGDAVKLVGKVKEKPQLGELKAEHYMDSVLLGESAYEVQQGFVGYPADAAVATQPGTRPPPGPGGKGTETSDQELLAKFLIENL